MLNQQSLAGMWDMMRQRHGITLRLVAAMPEDKLHSHPVPGMRTPVELIVHLYETVVRAMVGGVPVGEVADTESTEHQAVARLKTRADILAFMNHCFEAASRAVASTTDAHLQGVVKTPWGFDMPGAMILGATHDEYLHHRGQLYVYARLLGVAPPMLWDFANNDAAYQPHKSQMA